MSCDQTADIGAYVLGALDPAERAKLESHLASCVECRAELSELAGLPGLLSRIDLVEAELIAAAPRELLPSVDEVGLQRLLGEVAGQRRARRRRQLITVAALLVVLAGAGGTAAAVSVAHRGGAAPITASAGPVHARVTLGSTAAGTTIALTLTGVEPEEHCWLVAVGKDGQTADAGSWMASYRGAAGIRGVTSIAADQIAFLRVVTSAGTLLTIPIAPGATPRTGASPDLGT